MLIPHLEPATKGVLSARNGITLAGAEPLGVVVGLLQSRVVENLLAQGWGSSLPGASLLPASVSLAPRSRALGVHLHLAPDAVLVGIPQPFPLLQARNFWDLLPW